MVSNNGLEMVDIMAGKKRINNCFLGICNILPRVNISLASNFVTWMTTQVRLTVDEALLAGNDLQSLGYIVPTGKKYAHLFEFSDDDGLYFSVQMQDSVIIRVLPDTQDISFCSIRQKRKTRTGLNEDIQKRLKSSN